MSRTYFMETERIGFSIWEDSDLDFAYLLWGDSEVTRYLCASGAFTPQEIESRLQSEIHNNEQHHMQYWPIFELATGDFIGCCGLRPFKSEKRSYELGFHMRKEYWGRGYAGEAAKAVIDYGFRDLEAAALYAGHHPQNTASRALLTKLGFQYVGTDFYEPTGLFHPLYELKLVKEPCSGTA